MFEISCAVDFATCIRGEALESLHCAAAGLQRTLPAAPRLIFDTRRSSLGAGCFGWLAWVSVSCPLNPRALLTSSEDMRASAGPRSEAIASKSDHLEIAAR